MHRKPFAISLINLNLFNLVQNAGKLIAGDPNEQLIAVL